MGTEDLTDVKIDVAVLNERYVTIQAALKTTNDAVALINVKFDQVLTEMHDAAARRKITSRVWAVVSHGATLILAVIVAKIFHEPIQLP